MIKQKSSPLDVHGTYTMKASATLSTAPIVLNCLLRNRTTAAMKKIEKIQAEKKLEMNRYLQQYLAHFSFFILYFR